MGSTSGAGSHGQGMGTGALGSVGAQIVTNANPGSQNYQALMNQFGQLTGLTYGAAQA